MIQFRNVSKSYGNSRALDSISFDIEDQDIFGILGESGAGKSTLLKIINQLDTHEFGEVIVNGIDVKTLNTSLIRELRKDIGVIFQDLNLLNHLTIYQNIALPLKLRGISDDAYIKELLEYIGLADRKDAYPTQLSGGQQQRVAIARSLVTRPHILLCDEPTSSLDPSTTQEILKLLKDVNQRFSTTIIIVTHDLDVAKKVCNRVAILEYGKIIDIVDVNPLSFDTDSRYSDRAREVLKR